MSPASRSLAERRETDPTQEHTLSEHDETSEQTDERPENQDAAAPARRRLVSRSSGEVAGAAGATLRRLAVPGLAALTVVLVLVGAFALMRAGAARDVPAAENQALVDVAGTAEVESAVAAALTAALSYDHRTPEASRAAAEAVLTGDAATDYQRLVTALVERAPEQGLVLTAEVDVLGVKLLTEDRAELLVFLDQSSTRTSDEQTSVAAAQVAVTAERVDGEWLITELRPL